jgi:ubiquinone/menaquinone biosynthesis C-methylase UbiE
MAGQETFETIARFYDLLYGDREDDLAMWLELAEVVEGPILEVGCGTGRVMVHLLQHDLPVVGLDISPLALQAAKAKLDAGGFDRLGSLHPADMRRFDLPEKNFGFAFIPINTLMHCETLADQQATLTSVARHLKTGGELVIDLFHPNPQTLLEADGRLILENQIIDELTGYVVQWFVIRRVNFAQQIQEVVFILDEIQIDGRIRRETISFPLRYLHRFEMELLLRNAGFTLVNILGDYDLSSFTDESPRMIFIAQKTATA